VITLQLNQAELLGITAAQLAPIGCTHQQFINGPVVGVPGAIDPNDYPFAYVANAAFADLTKWIDFNQPPPHAQRIETTSTTPATIVEDQFGNALGGVRTPFVDVPTTTYTPTDTVSRTTEFSGFCVLYGYNTPFSDSTLDSLYRNHFEYIGKVLVDSYGLVAQGLWLAPDAQAVVQKALKADVRSGSR
jgi:Alpha/beta hydrolase domain